MRLALADLPLETRATVAWELVYTGVIDAYDAIRLVLWPGAIAVIRDHHAPAAFCRNGHLWTDETTYYSPNGHTRRCRACKNEKRRGVVHQRITCRHGHLMTEENTITRRGWPECRECKNARNRALYARKKEAA